MIAVNILFPTLSSRALVDIPDNSDYAVLSHAKGMTGCSRAGVIHQPALTRYVPRQLLSAVKL